MSRKPKLELTWIGKDVRPRLEPRILIEDPALSHHAATKRDGDIFDNMLIQGDNLLALKALELEYAGKVKCVFIDPPYNTGSAFSHYDDGLEHSLWLSMMRDRLTLIRALLSEDGSLWITIDDNESHYLKVLCDEIFGRMNFVSNAIWQKKFSPANDARLIDNDHDHILVYSKSREVAAFNLLPRTEAMDSRYKNPDRDPRGPWTPGDALRREFREYAFYEIETPSGRKVKPPPGTSWRFNKEDLPKLIADGRIWFGADGNGVPRIKRFLSDVKNGIVPQSIWLNSEVGNTQEAKKEAIALDSKDIFATPKPERLIHRVLHIATNPGELVLDSFAGSGTTGAVAHKMSRRWIMVELGEHAKTHISPRLTKVIDGADTGGVTEAVGWQGGGGYRFFRLAPSLLSEDKYGNWVISKDYNAAMLAEALCKHMGYTYAPSQSAENYWQHGQSTETDFIYVTTQQLTHNACKKIADDVGPDRSLLICCKAYSANADAFDNLTLVKIPTAILKKCEWGRDDYSLAIKDLPAAVDDVEEPMTTSGHRSTSSAADLFDEDEL
jgi:adenine-specific DNA-methyltransferase